MRQVLSSIIIICLLLYPVASIRGQNSLINPYGPQHFLLKGDNLIKIPSVELEKKAVEQIEIGTYDIVSDYPLSNEFYHKSFSLMIKDSDVFQKFPQDLGLSTFRTIDTGIEVRRNTTVDRKLFNALYNKPKINEKDMIRQAWKRVFGIDVWYPYYKAKDVERWVKKRLTVKIFKLKGEPQFQRNQITYTFKVKF